MAIADRIAVMNDGRLVEAGPPLDLYRAPRTLFTATFLGHANIVDLHAEGGLAEAPWGGEEVVLSRAASGTVRVAIRPEAIVMTPAADQRNWVADVTFPSATALHAVALGNGGAITVSCRGADALVAPGTPVRLWTPGPLHLLDGDAATGSGGALRETSL